MSEPSHTTLSSGLTPVPEVSPEADEVSTRRFIVKSLLYLGAAALIFIAVAAVAQRLLGHHLTSASEWLTVKGGYPALFLSVWAIDTFTIPFSPDIILAFVAHKGSQLPHVNALAVISVASILAGNTGYYVARWLESTNWVRRRLAKNHRRGKAMFERFGVWAVVIAGFSPVPFSLVCWLAGLYHMNRFKFFLATLSRIPRFVGWYYVIRFGFSL